MARITVELTMLNKLSKPVDKAKGSLNRLDFEAKKAFKNAAAAAGAAVNKISNFASRVANSVRGVMNLRNAMIALVAVGVAKYAINAASSIEVMAMQLRIVSESGEKAAQAMKAIREFARTSPLETEDVVQSFVRLRAVGIDPTLAQLKTIGGVAVLFNREMSDVLDAFIGMNKRTLRKLGVEIDRTGSMAIIKSGDIRKEVNKDSASIRAALLEIWEERFPDAITDAADTTKSKVAIMKSNIFELAVSVGEKLKPAFDSVVVSIGNMAEKLRQFLFLTRDDAATKAQQKIVENLKNDAAILEDEIKSLEATAKSGGVALDQFLNPIDPKRLSVARAELRMVTEDIARLEKTIKDKGDVGGSGSLGAPGEDKGGGGSKAIAAEAKAKYEAGKKALAEIRKIQYEDAKYSEDQKKDVLKAGIEAYKKYEEDKYLSAEYYYLKNKALKEKEKADAIELRENLFSQSMRLESGLADLARVATTNSKLEANKKKRILRGLAVADAAAAAVSGVRSAMDLPFPANLLAGAATIVEVLAMTAGQISAINSATFARGTMGARGGNSIVGEQGPERVKLPTGSQVYTNSQTRQMINNTSSVTIPVTINGNATPAMVGLIKDELGSFARRMEDAIRYGKFDPAKVGLVTM